MPFTSAGLELMAASIVSFPRAPSIPSQQESRSHCVGAGLYILLGPHTIVFLDCWWQTHSKVAVATKEVERGSGIRAIQEHNPGTAWAACTSCVIRICHCLACVLSSLHTVNEIAPVVVLNHSSSLRTSRKGVFLEKCHRNSPGLPPTLFESNAHHEPWRGTRETLYKLCHNSLLLSEWRGGDSSTWPIWNKPHMGQKSFTIRRNKRGRPAESNKNCLRRWRALCPGLKLSLLAAVKLVHLLILQVCVTSTEDLNVWPVAESRAKLCRSSSESICIRRACHSP